MAKDVNDAFGILIDRLKPSEVETISAASHRASIDACLKEKFKMTSLFRSGSFGHGTSVKGYSDVDYFAVIPAANLWTSSNYSLIKVKEALQARFPLTSIAIRSPVVIVPFGGGAGGEHHEISPAYANGTNNGHTVYAIPNRTDGWMSSSPNAHNAWVNVINDKHSKKVKQLIRLLKYWNYVQSAGIRSFYLELRTAEYANYETAILYNIDVKRMFAVLINKGLAAMQDPQGVSGYVYPCSDAVKESALSKLRTALTRAEKAYEAENAGKYSEAFQWWDMVFGGKFPAYY
ncbi:hypothetical protein X747_28750 [Mesorhizobium sp. LNJC384A00]|uniref:SMODS domain-containing nucleotidyltransferase n=1 Tax=Mesorhizobium sp. LNJC384A00 TaxID=1287268 RepID=UPI0003CDE9E3|nr:nucleotidyltransferase [Mesorhizobium sp. LNJC384A00]ESY35257.1 hypothetical protein X747_28750 [Mesorhizobium sp. LNJC384A00]